jgi:hypothetical protein
MSGNLNWSGNKGLDPNASQKTRTPSPFIVPSDLRSLFNDPLLTQGPGTGQQGTSTPRQDTAVAPRPTASQQRQQESAPPVQDQLEPIMDVQGPPPATEEGFIPAYLRRNLGRNVRAEFIVGTNQYTDRTGRLIEVGTNYFVLEDVNSRTHIMCDLYSVKFVTILQI